MKVQKNDAYRAFVAGAEQQGLLRIKGIRDQSLTPGGRAVVSMFERVGQGRSHPRMHITMPPAVDPDPPGTLFRPPSASVSEADVAEIVGKEKRRNDTDLSGSELDISRAPKGSESYWRNSIRAQRLLAFFADVRAWAPQSAAAAVQELEDEAFAGTVDYDDADTGTYHSYGHDAPFVHYLEKMIESLPRDGQRAMALLGPGQQASVRRQRKQLTAHLDHLMRHKYAFDGIQETDIERTLGGMADRQA